MSLVPHKYNDPANSLGAGAVPSTIGPQINTAFYQKKALIEARKEMYFGQLADTTVMPKHHGKAIKVFHYIPLLDDRNQNDQGIDAAGATINPGSGNLYGSSRDIGYIAGRMPVLREEGGRVNRVGFTRKEIVGTLQKYGFFFEYTNESLQFDTDPELYMHLHREAMRGAVEVNEDLLMMDLLTQGTTDRYLGNATSITTTNKDHLVTYADLIKLSIDLDNNDTPKHTKIITGTRLIDTRVIPAARYLFIGSELLYTLMGLKDLHDKAAFIPVEQYAAAGQIAQGEVGAIAGFRVIVVPRMVKWSGQGDAGGTSTNVVYETAGKPDVFPMLAVGDGSFSQVGFETNGKESKFTTYEKKPGYETANRDDPYGEIGFMSIKWYYGFLALRPERIALIHTVALM